MYIRLLSQQQTKRCRYTKKNKGKKNRSEGSNGLIRVENCQLELNELFRYTKLSQLRMTMPLPYQSHFVPESIF